MSPRSIKLIQTVTKPYKVQSRFKQFSTEFHNQLEPIRSDLMNSFGHYEKLLWTVSWQLTNTSKRGLAV